MLFYPSFYTVLSRQGVMEMLASMNEDLSYLKADCDGSHGFQDGTQPYFQTGCQDDSRGQEYPQSNLSGRKSWTTVAPKAGALPSPGRIMLQGCSGKVIIGKSFYATLAHFEQLVYPIAQTHCHGSRDIEFHQFFILSLLFIFCLVTSSGNAGFNTVDSKRHLLSHSQPLLSSDYFFYCLYQALANSHQTRRSANHSIRAVRPQLHWFRLFGWLACTRVRSPLTLPLSSASIDTAVEK